MEVYQFSGPLHNDRPFRIQTSAPSNIALVKYWGKHGQQLPKNPSISFTLDKCKTQTEVTFTPAVSGGNFSFAFEGQPKPDFHPKLQTFFDKIRPYCPYLDSHDLAIQSQNSFPHSSGIASSASAMAALALALLGLEKNLNPELSDSYFWEKASFLARLGSGSAARSLQGPLMLWGTSKHLSQSSDHIAIPLGTDAIHPIFQDYQDTILLIDRGQKKVSSTQGHQLMHGHPFAEARFIQAQKNTGDLLAILKAGDLDAFIPLVESEALTLHALMMSSQPYFILMHANTLQVLERLWAFRKQTQIPLCFTLDAGANVHLLYPKDHYTAVQAFIQSDLVAFCQDGQYIDDQVGSGAKIH